MLEQHIVENCAPTLAGHKTGSLFCCPYENRQALCADLRQVNEKLGGKGLRALPLRLSQKRALVYLYRPAALRRDLADRAAGEILRRAGYTADNENGCIRELIRRLHMQGEFPHEIGLFLGYPPEDVCGFMERGGRGCKCVGCWKVYGDEKAAREKFDLYKKCTRVYCDCWERGRELEQLAVKS